mgnify:CR=1 FL=1
MLSSQLINNQWISTQSQHYNVDFTMAHSVIIVLTDDDQLNQQTECELRIPSEKLTSTIPCYYLRNLNSSNYFPKQNAT